MKAKLGILSLKLFNTITLKITSKCGINRKKCYQISATVDIINYYKNNEGTKKFIPISK